MLVLPQLSDQSIQPNSLWHKLTLTGLKASFVASMCLFLVDFFTYSGAVHKHLGFSALEISLVVGLGHWALIKLLGFRFNQLFSKVLLLQLAPIVLLLANIALLLEASTILFPNYFLVNFGVHYSALPALALGCLLFGVIHTDKQFYQSVGKQWHLALSVCIIAGMGILYLTEPDVYRAIAREDSIIEYATAIGFGVASVLAARVGRYAPLFVTTRLAQRAFWAACIGVAVIFLFGAGEEISWGQRIFDVATPESISMQNRQNEINVHNLEVIWPFVYTGYQAIALYGMCAGFVVWLVSEWLPNSQRLRNWVALLVPEPYLALNFLLIFVYTVLRTRFGPWKYVAWEELSEMLLIIGILTHLTQQLLRLSHAAQRAKRK